MKCLILLNGRFGIDRYFINNVDMESCQVNSLYEIYNKNIKYLLAAFWMEKCKFPIEQFWYGKWKKNIREYDIVIVFATNLSWRVLSYIRRKNNKCRIIVWNWDSLNKRRKLPEKYKQFCEVWSFDEKDCVKYGMNWNSQFYWPLEVSQRTPTYDVIFIGRDKGRVQQLNDIVDFIREKGLSVYTYIQDDKIDRKWFQKKNKKEIEYEEVINLVTRTKCVIDIPKKGQYGITIRVLESIFYSKKLITTDSNIKNHRFYNKRNVFIWQEDDKEKLIEFINSEFIPIEEEIKKFYLFEEWLKRFKSVSK